MKIKLLNMTQTKISCTYKTFIFSLLILSFIGCNQKSSTKIRASYIKNGVIKKDEIIRDVEQSLLSLSNGIIKNDATLIFSIFSKIKDTQYVRDGYIYPSVKKAEKQYASWLKGSRIDRDFTFTRKEFTILNDSTVFFTGIGVINGDKPWTIAYTILWAQENAGWKALNMHISWDKK